MKKSILFILVAAIAGFSLSGCIVLGAVSRPPGQSRSVTRNLQSVSIDNNETVMLEAGTFTGTLRIDANNATVRGAGVGRTVIRGDVIIDGNANTILGFAIDGRVSVSGNTNDLTGVELSQAELSVRGNNNRY